MRINTNVSAMNAFRNLGNTENAVSKSMQKLSSGFRINRASDDAAGLAIANRLHADLRSLQQASRNAEQANSMLQVMEGGTQQVQKILERMKELATQSNSGTVDDTVGRVALNTEFTTLISEMDRIVNTTTFNGQALLAGGFGSSVDSNIANSTVLGTGTGVSNVHLSGAQAGTYALDGSVAGKLKITLGTVSQTVDITAGRGSVNFSTFGITLDTTADFSAGAGSTANGKNIVVTSTTSGAFMVSSSGAYSGDDQIKINAIDIDSTSLSVNTEKIDSMTNAQTALGKIDAALKNVNGKLADLGAAQNRIDYATQNVKTSIENISAAESTIRDVDMAEEMTTFSKNQILQQAGTAMLAQANQLGQGVLQLLRG